MWENARFYQRRKGIAWTAQDHRLFLQGLAKLGRGDWRGISRNFVLSRTPTQVATHAQKFFLRLKDNDNGKRRRSIYDITSAADITEAFDTGMLSLPGPVTNCTADAIEGPSAVNPEKFPLGASVGSDLNSSFPGMVEFLRGIEGTSPLLSLQPSVAGDTRMYTHPDTVAAEGTSGAKRARRGVDTRTSPSLSLQQSVAGGTGMYTHVTVPAEGTSGARHGVDTKTYPLLSLQPSVTGGTGMYTHVTVPAEGTSGARLGVDTRTSSSLSLQQSVVGGTRMYTYPVNNVRYDLEELMTKQLVGATQVGTTINTASLPLPIADHTGVHGCTASSSGANIGFASTMGASEGGFSVNSIQLPSIPGSSCGGTYPCWDPSNQDDYIFDLEDLFSDHIFGFGK